MLIEFNTLSELLDDLRLDGDFDSPIRVAPVEDVYNLGATTRYTFDVQVRAINRAGHILGWTYRTGWYDANLYAAEEPEDGYRTELSRRVKMVEEWLRLAAGVNRVRPGTIWTDGNITLGEWMEEEDG